MNTNLFKNITACATLAVSVFLPSGSAFATQSPDGLPPDPMDKILSSLCKYAPSICPPGHFPYAAGTYHLKDGDLSWYVEAEPGYRRVRDSEGNELVVEWEGAVVGSAYELNYAISANEETYSGRLDLSKEMDDKDAEEVRRLGQFVLDVSPLETKDGFFSCVGNSVVPLFPFITIVAGYCLATNLEHD